MSDEEIIDDNDLDVAMLSFHQLGENEEVDPEHEYYPVPVDINAEDDHDYPHETDDDDDDYPVEIDAEEYESNVSLSEFPEFVDSGDDTDTDYQPPPARRRRVGSARTASGLDVIDLTEEPNHSSNNNVIIEVGSDIDSSNSRSSRIMGQSSISSTSSVAGSVEGPNIDDVNQSDNDARTTPSSFGFRSAFSLLSPSASRASSTSTSLPHDNLERASQSLFHISRMLINAVSNLTNPTAEINQSLDNEVIELDMSDVASQGSTIGDGEDDSSRDSATRSSWESRRLVRRNAIALPGEEEVEGPVILDENTIRIATDVDNNIEGALGNVAPESVAGANGQLESAQPQAVQNENTSGATVETKNTSTETNQKSAIANSGLDTSKASNDDDDDGMTCIICYEPYTNSGEHRLSCIKCGHTFGKACIEKWIKHESRCPQCNAKAHRKDIRVIYVKNLKALDTAERDRAMGELEKERIAKKKLELEYAKLDLRYRDKEMSCRALQVEIQLMRDRTGSLYRQQGDASAHDAGIAMAGTSYANGAKFGFHYTLLKELDMQSECRVGVFNPWLNMMIVSQSMKNPLYPQGAHGIKRINLIDMKISQTTQLHQKEIRDLCFSTSQSDILLSVGMDKKAILTNCNSNVTIQSYQTDYPLWSCAWNELNQYVFYIGTANGSIISHDIRKPNEVLKTVTIPSDEDRSPIARLLFVNPSYSNLEKKFSLSGLLVQKLNSLWFWEMRGTDSNENERFHQLPIEGPFLSVDFEPVSRHLLVSTKNKGEGKHMICELVHYFSEGQSANICSCNVVNSYPNQVSLSKMSRTSIYAVERQTPGSSTGASAQSFNNVLMATNGPQNTAKIFSISDANWKQTIGLNEPVLDFVPCSVNFTHMLGLVTSSRVHLYKDSKAN